MVSGVMLPFAFMLSKVFKTEWKLRNNPLQPLGMWLNLAQLFYFPFLIFTMIKFPDYFVMVYAIITGAHFFPYAWFYQEKAYAVFAGVISIGSLFAGLYFPIENIYVIPLFTAASLVVLGTLIFASYKSKERKAAKV